MKPLFDAVVLATIASYAQGMDILREASAVYKYGLNMPCLLYTSPSPRDPL